MVNTLNKIIGERIRAARKEKGLKQFELAEKLDFSAASISNIEIGSQSILLIDLYKMAEVLGKKIDYFLPSVKELRNALPSIDRDKKRLSPEGKDYIDKLRGKIEKEE